MEKPMRGLALFVTGAALASCSMAPEPLQRSPSGQRAYESLFAGRVAGQPVNCLPNYNSNDMSIIDGQTVAFRVGTRTVYRVQLSQGCGQLGTGTTALLTRQFGGAGMCRGDIAQVVDTMNRMTVGSCVIQDIRPFVRPG
jgi:hypothetical protein